MLEPKSVSPLRDAAFTENDALPTVTERSAHQRPVLEPHVGSSGNGRCGGNNKTGHDSDYITQTTLRGKVAS